MLEKPRTHESATELSLFQVVMVPFEGGPKRCVVVVPELEEQPGEIGISQIIAESTEQERLGYSGTVKADTVTPTDEHWEKSRAIEAIVATYGESFRPDVEREFSGIAD